jgi:hypothetical protein
MNGGSADQGETPSERDDDRARVRGEADRRGLSALFWSHLNLYGKFELDMSKQLDLGPVPGLDLGQAS